MNDVFPIENGDVPVSHVSELRGVVAELPFFLVVHEVLPCRKLTYPTLGKGTSLTQECRLARDMLCSQEGTSGRMPGVNVPTLKPEIIEKLTPPSCFNIYTFCIFLRPQQR